MTMIKRSLAFLTLTIMSIISFEVKAQEFFGGPVVGISACQVDGDSFVGYHKFGPIIGGFVGRQIGKNWKAQLEISYIQKGSRKQPDAEVEDYTDYLIRLDYIQFPVTVELMVGKFSFDAGLGFASLLSYKEEVDGAPIDEAYQVPFESFELSSIFGVSYHLNERLKMNFRFNYSLLPIREPFNGEIDVYEPLWDARKPGQYNDVVTFSLFYDLYRK